MKTRLLLKEQRFLDAFFGSANGNATKAAITAGYSTKTAKVIASKLLAKPIIQEKILIRQARDAAASIATAEERDETLTKILRSGDEDVNARIKAVQELNRCTGRHSLRHEVGGRLLLEQVLANSRGDV